ncbi:MAG: hypothetical protein DI565_14015 [Ancylobacter novellus]|uniref:Uncharacterized protein n=1 Tax=Ancylobacter novellus TaxID=921 RepID=A0A2W5M8C4_ANCNO|nr:MAG: hypothetical protein DI565_14015 [Ancylobacter novellus]
MPRKKETPENRAKELGQILTALEISICIIAVVGFANKPRRISLVVGHLRGLANQALYQTDGPDPTTLDRLADQIEIGHEATS